MQPSSGVGVLIRERVSLLAPGTGFAGSPVAPVAPRKFRSRSASGEFEVWTSLLTGAQKRVRLVNLAQWNSAVTAHVPFGRTWRS